MSRLALRRIALFGLAFSCALAFGPSLRADVKLHSIFTSEAVLQQGMKIPIFGTADDGESVLVRIQDQEASTVAVDGKWEVEIGPLVGSDRPHQLTVTGNKRLTVHNVFIGEVWVCAGGANMQLPILQSEGFGSVVTTASNQPIRLFPLKREGAVDPQESTSTAVWMRAGAASVGTFSAVGYHFGRALQKHVKVPVGLISCNHYESSIESWISRAALGASPELNKALAKPITSTDTRSPTVLFNAMVNPITRYAVRGVVWYHGESSVESAYEYRIGLSTMIADWRKHWGNDKLPFVIVQVAPHRIPAKVAVESKYAELRESQLLISKQIPDTALVVITDYGDQNNMRPPQKEPVGQRAALAAQGLVYHDKAEFMGPIFDSATFARNEATLKFRHVGGGLAKKGDELQGFFICGPDRAFQAAKAEIKGNTVVVSSDQVPVAESVRYGWSDFPIVNLINKEGLPASPFRTDNYPLLTQPKAK
jgi:sialate O-acetylesterase